MTRRRASSSGSSLGFYPAGSRLKNPFYLHLNDNPGTPLITLVLNGNNYVEWSRLAKRALFAKNKLGFINGNIIKPKTDSPNFNVWKRCNDMVISWITNTLAPAILRTVVRSTNAFELWNDLHQRFSKSNGLRIHRLKRDIVACVQDSDSIATYYTKLQKLWNQYDKYNSVPNCFCGALKEMKARDENEKSHQFLMGLNESFSDLKNQILLMMPLPTVIKIQSLCLELEKERKLHVKANTI